MECLDDNVATEFVSGSLSKPATAKVEGHLAGCRDCRALVAALASDSPDDSDLATRPHEKPSPSQVAMRPSRMLGIGDRVGRYLVLSTLGAGGMGVVFSAYDPQLDRKVALKLLRAGARTAGNDARARLKREAQAIAQLNHPNVVAVYDVGAIDDATGGDIYVAMEFVEGDTLTAWLKRWPRSWRDIVDVFQQAGRGLYAAHSVGLLHRDFKPDNVLVGGDGRVRVGDFGLARSLIEPPSAAEESSRMTPGGGVRSLDVALTATGTVLGTPRYMPPEQLTGPDIDARSDQFSFCVALYEALYGAHPLPGSTSASMLEKNERALPPPEDRKVPPVIARAVLRGLERDRSKRFQSMHVLLHELDVVPTRSPMRWVAASLAAIVLVGGAAAAVIARSDSPSVQPPTDAVQVLIAKINAKEQERRQLRAQLENLQGSNRKEIDELKAQIDVRDRQIHVLDQQVGTLKQEMVRSRRLIPRLPPSQSVQVEAAIQDAENNIEGCFNEWTDRRPNRDADLLVRLEVSPTGLGHSAVATGVDDSVLPDCVARAISHVTFPIGPEQLDVEVAVGWSQGVTILSPRVVGHHQAPRGVFDLE